MLIMGRYDECLIHGVARWRIVVATTRGRTLPSAWWPAVGVCLLVSASCGSVEVAHSAAGPAVVQSGSDDAGSFGPWVHGLRMHAALPTRAARGDILRCDLSADLDESESPTPPAVDGRPLACVARLRLTDATGAEVAVIAAIDPCCGSPDPPPPDGNELDQLAVDPASGVAPLGVADFPLASQWDRVPEGRYRGVVEVPWTGEVHGRAVDGAWRGTLVSQPFVLEVSAAPECWLELRVPARLTRSGVATTERIPVRNGFVFVLTWSGNLPGGSTGGREGGALRPGMFDATLSWLEASSPRADVTVFEMSPEHLGRRGPTRGDRVIWRNR